MTFERGNLNGIRLSRREFLERSAALTTLVAIGQRPAEALATLRPFPRNVRVSKDGFASRGSQRSRATDSRGRINAGHSLRGVREPSSSRGPHDSPARDLPRSRRQLDHYPRHTSPARRLLLSAAARRRPRRPYRPLRVCTRARSRHRGADERTVRFTSFRTIATRQLEPLQSGSRGSARGPEARCLVDRRPSRPRGRRRCRPSILERHAHRTSRAIHGGSRAPLEAAAECARRVFLWET
jgi:hypothetical protein